MPAASSLFFALRPNLLNAWKRPRFGYKANTVVRFQLENGLLFRLRQLEGFNFKPMFSDYFAVALLLLSVTEPVVAISVGFLDIVLTPPL